MRCVRYIKNTLLPVPPQIQHFSFGEEAVNSGDIVAVQCAVLKGDLPIEITWTLNGRSLAEWTDVDVGRSGARISALNIESVRDHHRGHFKCVAANQAGRAELAAELMVNGNAAVWWWLSVADWLQSSH